MVKVLEVNVDDLYSGGVFSLIKNIIINKNEKLDISIAAIEKFEKDENLDVLSRYGCNVYYVGYDKSKLKKQIYVYKNLKKLIKTQKFDYIHIHADVANKLLVSGLAAKNAGANNIIFHSHAAGIDGNHRKIKFIVHKICSYFLKMIGTKYVACSKVAAEWMFPNININKIILINNGVDLNKFCLDKKIRNRVRKELKAEDIILLGHVGRFCYQKNHNYFIGILKILKQQNIPAKLLLIGEGPGENEFKEKIKENHLDDMTIFYGTSNKVNELFMAMDIFLLPSHFEGLPIVGVEAQATGLPSILSDKITTETKLINEVEFIGINNQDVTKWVATIKKFINRTKDRSKAYYILKEKKFSIKDTIDSFLRLYTSEK